MFDTLLQWLGFKKKTINNLPIVENKTSMPKVKSVKARKVGEIPSILKKKKAKGSRTLSSQVPKDKRQYNPLVGKEGPKLKNPSVATLLDHAAKDVLKD